MKRLLLIACIVALVLAALLTVDVSAARKCPRKPCGWRYVPTQATLFTVPSPTMTPGVGEACAGGACPATKPPYQFPATYTPTAQ